MSQETNNTQSTPETGQPTANQSGDHAGQNLVEELNRLGSKFVEVVQVAWESDQRKKIEQDLKSGLTSLANSLEEGLKKVGESPQTKEFLNKAEDVAETVTERVQKSQLAQDLADGLVKGLRSLTEQIDKVATELQSKNRSTTTTTTPGAGTTANPDQPHDIPITKV